MPLNPGARLGPYEVLAPIGAGGTGEVYRARHVELGRSDAVKVLADGLAADPERRTRLERETRAAAALNHPNIVTIHDIAEQDGTVYLAMELVGGPTLRNVLADRPLALERILEIAIRIADGLARAHEADILHRDVKPANVMLTVDGRVKILDFGLAKPVGPAAGDDGARPVTAERRVDELPGTPRYMSPEQLSGAPAGPRSDQFAFGVLLYEMIAGAPPFGGDSLTAVVDSILTEDPPPLRPLRSETPTDLERIVRRCLEKDPEKRFPSMKEVRVALQEVVARRTSLAYRLRAAIGRPLGAAWVGAGLLALVR